MTATNHALWASLAFALTLAGCGGSSSSSKGSATSAVSSASSVTTATTATTGSGTTPTPAPPPPPAPPPVAVTTGPVTRTVQTTAQAGLPSISHNYTVYVPTGYDPTVATPVVIASNMGLTPWQALADAETILVVDFRDRDMNGGYDFNYDVLILNAIINDVEAGFAVDDKRIYYHGFSAGAHWGYTIVLANANTFAALAINAGSLGNAVNQGIFPNNVQRPIPVVIRHGSQDQVVPVTEGTQARDLLTGQGHTVVYEAFAGGHTIAPADAAAVWPFLRQQRAP